MAAHSSRLGRGLGSIIQNGTSQAPAVASTKKKKIIAAKQKRQASNSKVKRTQNEKVLPPASNDSLQSADIKSQASMPGNTAYIEIPLAHIDTNPYQPRKEALPEGIQELAESICSEGLLQPIVVRFVDKRYQLIAGERRCQACKLLKWRMITARIVDASDASSAVIALIENLQRENLNPVDEAFGYASLMRDFDLTQQGVSERVGKARASIANALRLLQLDQEIQSFIKKNLLSVGHAKVLAGIEDQTQRSLLARQTIEKQYSVRELEQCAKRLQNGTNGAVFVSANPQSPSFENAQDALVVNDLEKRLTHYLNTPVMIQRGRKRNKIIIEYRKNEDLDHVLECIGLSQ